MAAKNDSHDPNAAPSKDQHSGRGRDASNGTHNDSSTVRDKETANPPHGHIAHGRGAFLIWVGRRREEIDGFDPSLDELGELYDEWRDSDEQADLGRWSE
jgi:hypothetical protein